MEYLPLHEFGNGFLGFYFVCSVFINFDCNKCGQTSRVVAGAQIQTSCNVEKDMYNRFWFLVFVPRRFICFYSLEYSYTSLVSILRYSFVFSHHNLRLHIRFSVLCVIIKYMFRTILLLDNNLTKKSH